MQCIRSRAHGRIHHRAAHSSILGAEITGDHFELGNSVRRGLRDLIGKPLVAGGIGVVIQPIQQEVVISAAHAVGVESAFARSGLQTGSQRRAMHVCG